MSDQESSSDEEEDLRGIFLRRNFGQCVFCDSITTFKQNFYYCMSCKYYFKALVRRATTLICQNTEPPYRVECEHCVLDLFYTYGMKIENVGITRSSLNHTEYLTDEIIHRIKDRESVNEMEKLFAKQLGKSFDEYLTWLNGQKILERIPLADQITLFKRNLGRGRLMWIICESIGVHSFLKLSDCYFNPWDATSLISRQIIKCVFDTAGLLSKAVMHDHMLYALKMISILHIGPVFETHPFIDFDRFVGLFCENLDKENISLQRRSDVAMILEHYWHMIKCIRPSERNSLPELDQILRHLSTRTGIIEDYLSKGNYPLYMTAEEFANKVIERLQRRQIIRLLDPQEIVRLPKVRIDLMRHLNKCYVSGIRYAKILIRHYVDIKDQKILFAYNLRNLVVQQLSWCLKGKGFPGMKTDEITFEFAWRLTYLYVKQTASPFSTPGTALLQIVILLLDPGSRERDHPLSVLERKYRRKLIAVLRRVDEETTLAKTRLLTLLDNILKCSQYLEDNMKHFPLLFDTRVLL